MTRYLITGATGRVAGVIARALAETDEVVAVARFSDPATRDRLEAAGVECVTADLASGLDAVPDDAEVLLHFAVTFSADWDEALGVNAEAIGHLADRLPRLERLLHCSTMGVYALSDGAHAETDRLGDSNAAMMPTYSISKIAGEVMARYVARARGVPTTIARLATPYGDHGGLPWFHLLPILAGEPVVLHPTSPCRYNLIHEDDIVAGLPLLLDAASVPATVVNWGDPEPTAAEDWCAHLAALVGREVTIERHPAAPPPGVLDMARLVALGYRPTEHRAGTEKSGVAARHPDELVG